MTVEGGTRTKNRRVQVSNATRLHNLLVVTGCLHSESRSHIPSPGVSQRIVLPHPPLFFLLVSSSHHPNNPTGRPQVEDSSNVTRRSHRHSYGTGLAVVLALPASGCHTEFVLEIEPPSTGHAPRKKNKKSASRDSPPLPSNHHLRPRNGLASAGDVASLQSTCQLTADHGGSRTPSCSAHALASAQQPSAGSSNATCSERPVSGITSQQPATVHCPPTGRLWLIASASPHRSSNNSPSLTETTASLAPRLHGNTVAPSSPRPSVVVAGRDTSRRPVNRR